MYKANATGLAKFWKDKENQMNKTCSICEVEYEGWGNNAEPVNEGRCCDECNWKYVIPDRMKRIKNLKKEEI